MCNASYQNWSPLLLYYSLERISKCQFANYLICIDFECQNSTFLWVFWCRFCKWHSAWADRSSPTAICRHPEWDSRVSSSRRSRPSRMCRTNGSRLGGPWMTSIPTHYTHENYWFLLRIFITIPVSESCSLSGESLSTDDISQSFLNNLW